MRFGWLLLLTACRGEPRDEGWCADEQPPVAPAEAPVTWWRDVKPISDQKCAACHTDGGHAPFSVATYAEMAGWAAPIRDAVAERRMPPWLPADCCQPYLNDFGLTDEEIATITAWVDQGAPEGDPVEEPEPREPIATLSRVDLTVAMEEPYTPDPPPGSIDDNRCFVLPWDVAEERWVTGLQPNPGTRTIVHHIIVAVVGPDGAEEIDALDAEDPEPGFDCNGGFGRLPAVTVLGGSLMGGDFPRGIGTKVEAGGRLILQIHYSYAGSDPPSDRTSVSFRLDEEAHDARGIAIANAAWLVGKGMLVEAGDDDAAFWYQFEPELYTRGRPVLIEGVTPHLHRYASRVRVMIVREDGSTECLLEIPAWEFGWEQPYWLAEPVPLDPGDELYLECRFDNSAANQPDGRDPRDIAWGDRDQDMCSAFLSFTEAE